MQTLRRELPKCFPVKLLIMLDKRALQRLRRLKSRVLLLVIMFLLEFMKIQLRLEPPILLRPRVSGRKTWSLPWARRLLLKFQRLKPSSSWFLSVISVRAARVARVVRAVRVVRVVRVRRRRSKLFAIFYLVKQRPVFYFLGGPPRKKPDKHDRRG